MAKKQSMLNGVLHIAVILVAFGSAAHAKCQSGSVGAYDYPQAPEYPVKEIVVFDPPFDEKPQMMYGLNFIDVNYAENFRVNSSLVYIDRYQAVLQMSTWHDTKLYGVGLSWMVCP